ncbi:MAG: Gfo/Idh/MocA family oxidoreductase [Alphaproteobacteria bacterium]|nr:Gfo/Idh/MocA family oxidoreductase [Alphaproteobacteria bacterium]
MRVIVAGLGVQGHKRRQIAGRDCVATVDPSVEGADYRSVADVPVAAYDAALLCTPDAPKLGLIRLLLERGKHVLVEKPLHAGDDAGLIELERLAKQRSLVCYTAYNHRFEPHFKRMRALVASGRLGRLYRCRMFYGNGTARLVRNSEWRDTGDGVLPDLGSHLLDTASFWFGDVGEEFEIVSCERFENRAPDHVVIASRTSVPRLELEMTLLAWRNHFTCDLFAELGSAHIQSLCKWGPSTFVHRTRVLPAGRPPEETETLEQSDPTWAAEYRHFVDLCARGGATDLSGDRWIGRVMHRLSGRIGKAT